MALLDDTAAQEALGCITGLLPGSARSGKISPANDRETIRAVCRGAGYTLRDCF